jgi:hypothetical protein
VDVLIAMGKLTKENHERWRLRQVPHLEKVMPGSLNQFEFLLRGSFALSRPTPAQTQPHGLYVLGQRSSSAAPIQQIWQPALGGAVLDPLRQQQINNL